MSRTTAPIRTVRRTDLYKLNSLSSALTQMTIRWTKFVRLSPWAYSAARILHFACVVRLLSMGPPNQFCSNCARKVGASPTPLMVGANDTVFLSSTWTGRPYSGFPQNMAEFRQCDLAIVSSSAMNNQMLGQLANLVRLLQIAYGWKFLSVEGASKTPDALLNSLTAGCGRLPSVLLLLDEESLLVQLASSPSFESVSLWLYNDDPHWHAADVASSIQRRAEKGRNLALAERLISAQATHLPRFYNAVDPAKCLWVPHGAGFEFILPINPYPVARVLLAGLVHRFWYPVRQILSDRASEGDQRIAVYAHPGYFPAEQSTPALIETGGPLRNKHNLDLAAAFNKHLACITDGSAAQYLLAKVFEITATGCLLLLHVDMVQQMKLQGFSVGNHFLAYHEDRADDVIEWILDPQNRAEVDSIRQRGRALTLARHLITHRAAVIHAEALRYLHTGH